MGKRKLWFWLKRGNDGFQAENPIFGIPIEKALCPIQAGWRKWFIRRYKRPSTRKNTIS